MIFKTSPFSIQDKNSRDLDNVKDIPTLAALNERTNSSDNQTDYGKKDSEDKPYI